MTLRRSAQVLLAAAALAAAGCGGDDKPDKASAPSSAQDSPSSAADVQRELKVSTDLSKKPEVPSLQGLPPEKLVTKDIVTGKGPAAKVGDNITVEYVGVSYSTDKEFDASWGKQPFTTELATTGIIKGWVQGIPGMKAGGRRVLVIPPDLGYGDQGQQPDIAPSETLIFVIDLKKVG